MPNEDVFNGKLPGQEYQGAIVVRREVSRIEAMAIAVTVALNDGVRLACIEYHNRTPDQWDAMTCRCEMQVQPLILTQEEIAKGSTTILLAIMVVLGTTASHQGNLT